MALSQISYNPALHLGNSQKCIFYILFLCYPIAKMYMKLFECLDIPWKELYMHAWHKKVGDRSAKKKYRIN